MKAIVTHETYGEIIYEESALTGKKSIAIGGAQLESLSKKEFKLQDGGVATVNGNVMIGASLNVNGETISLTPKVKWYEILLCILPLILTLTWGNIPQLCLIVPLVGGAIGGAIGGVFSVIGFYVMRIVKPVGYKILIALASLGLTFGICCGIGFAFLGSM